MVPNPRQTNKSTEPPTTQQILGNSNISTTRSRSTHTTQKNSAKRTGTSMPGNGKHNHRTGATVRQHPRTNKRAGRNEQNGTPMENNIRTSAAKPMGRSRPTKGKTENADASTRRKRRNRIGNRKKRVEGGMLLVIPPESPPRPRSGTASGGLPEPCPQAEAYAGLELCSLAYSGVWCVAVFTVVVGPYPQHTESATTPSVAEGQIAKLRTPRSFGGNEAPMPPNPYSPSSPEMPTLSTSCGIPVHEFAFQRSTLFKVAELSLDCNCLSVIMSVNSVCCRVGTAPNGADRGRALRLFRLPFASVVRRWMTTTGLCCPKGDLC